MTELDWNCTPDDVLAHWPDELPLAALVTGAGHGGHARLSMLAVPVETIECRTHLDALAALAHAGAGGGGTWCIAAAYELARAFEPTALPRARMPDDGWPMATLVRCGARLELDHASGRWTAHEGAERLAEELGGRMRSGTRAPGTARIDGLEPDLAAGDYERMVATAVRLVHAGDIFQANVAQRFSARWSGSRRAIMRAALTASRPRYGAWIETPTHALASMSPELFLEVDRTTGSVVTRPIKGTRAAHEPASGLMASPKDAAELHMIVDLMRNDLGRACVPGSVQVTSSRELERHETVHHAAAEVRGTLRPGTGLVDLLRATFPPGSVTGAPKVRAMQVIDELEPSARGPYCGAIGLASPGRIALNVAIRTIALAGADGGPGALRYLAGCGIVAESDPRQEHEESLHKSAVLVRTALAVNATGAPRACAPSAPPAPPPCAGAPG
jgi:anthranilate/para-aminobenzoate synthase component I